MDIPKSMVCGGAKSPLWRTILANVLGIPLETCPRQIRGRATAAQCWLWPAAERMRVSAAYSALVQVADTVQPETELIVWYEERYQKFKQIYPALKNIFPILK